MEKQILLLFLKQCDDPTETDRWVNIMKQNLPTTQISLVCIMMTQLHSPEILFKKFTYKT